MDLVLSESTDCDILNVFGAKIHWFLNDFNKHYKAATGRDLEFETSKNLKNKFMTEVAKEIKIFSKKVAEKVKTEEKYLTKQKNNLLYEKLKRSIETFMKEFEKIYNRKPETKDFIKHQTFAARFLFFDAWEDVKECNRSNFFKLMKNKICKMANVPPLPPGKNLFTYINNYNKERKKRKFEEEKKKERDILDSTIPRKKIKPFYFEIPMTFSENTGN
ncbi:7020_t:CDS:2 [Entrophospora sp. SA101]|nr:7020_t:CDS:2 [Entrophospora sp. SA101]